MDKEKIKLYREYECKKDINECVYRFDYRGCIRENCKFKDEFDRRQAVFNRLNKFK